MSTFYITLPNGKKTGLGTYVSAWKAIKKLPPNASVPGFFDFADSAGRVLNAMRSGIDDRINKRGAVDTAYKEMNSSRVRRGIARTVKCECRWCGSELAEYADRERRFCSAGCRKDYFN